MTVSAKAFIQPTRQRCGLHSAQRPKEFFLRHGLHVRQPIGLACHFFIASQMLASGFHLRWIARSHDPQWTMCLRADKGSARRGRTCVRRAIASAIRALGGECQLADILVHRRRQMYDAVFMHEGGVSGMLRFRQSKASYRIDKPLG